MYADSYKSSLSLTVRITSLAHEIVQPARFVRQQSSADCYAVFNLRLTPVAGLRSICFANEAPTSQVEPRITAAIEKGVMQFVKDSEEHGRPVGGLRVTPFDIQVHPVVIAETSASLSRPTTLWETRFELTQRLSTLDLAMSVSLHSGRHSTRASDIIRWP